MRMFLTTDEWYPVYGLSELDKPYLYQKVVDVPSELVEEWKEAEQLFEVIQEKLSRLPTTRIEPTEKLW